MTGALQTIDIVQFDQIVFDIDFVRKYFRFYTIRNSGYKDSS